MPLASMMRSAGIEPTVSVLLPVRDGAATLRRAIESVLAQSFADFELLVLDDGSRDSTVDVAFSFTDQRVRVIGGGRHVGLAARLNEGIALAKGRYIARMDCDDVSFPLRFERQVRFLDENTDVHLVGCRAIAFRDDGTIIGLLPFAGTHEEICRRPWRGFPLPHPTWMGRAEWFRRFGYKVPEARRAEDQELLLRAYIVSRYACIDEVLVGYSQGPFVLRKTLTARRAVLASQLRLFAERRQWSSLCIAVFAAFGKIAVDLFAALPGCERLFLLRMSEPATQEVVRELHKHVPAQAAA